MQTIATMAANASSTSKAAFSKPIGATFVQQPLTLKLARRPPTGPPGPHDARHPPRHPTPAPGPPRELDPGESPTLPPRPRTCRGKNSPDTGKLVVTFRSEFRSRLRKSMIISLAEREGFEPPLGLLLSLISSQVPSTTQPPFPPLIINHLHMFRALRIDHWIL